MGRKQASLSLRVSQEAIPPAVILLQEPGKKSVKIKDYVTFEEDQYVATLMHKLYSATKREFESQGASSCYLTVIPVKTGDQAVHVVNIYCNPKDHKTDIRRVVSTAVEEAGRDPVVIAGDFNAPHPAWGYRFVTPKGRRLAEVINRERLTLLTDSDQPTRTGSSTTRDTCPDLTIVKNVESAEWRNLQEQLGSDHCILETIIHRRGFKRKLGKTKITDWDKWRKQRSGIPPTIENIEEWTKTISDSIKPFSTEVERTDKDPDVDKHLLHLWEARRALTKRWKRQRHNKVLRKKIAELTTKAEEYAIKLASQNWYGVCDRIRGNLGSAQSWRLLRALIDPGKTKTATTNRLAELVFKIPEPQDRIMDQLATRYLCLDPPVVQPDYEGRENPDLDRSITVEELEYEELVRHFNEVYWEKGITPDAWKTADVRFIPKPKKDLKLENLRPISLTSCLGKAFERVINTRLIKHIDKNQLLPNTQFGFRPHTSTQDLLLWLYKDLLEDPPKGQTRCILALDLKGAFDNVSHESILRGLSQVDCGRKTYNYVQSFLSGRTATLTLGNIKSGKYNLGPRGTPQGAVLSPLLFNLAMRGLPGALQAVPQVEHAIYADDITLWCRSGSDGQIEEGLQRAADIAAEYARSCGLRCAPEKSELLILHNPREKQVEHINILVDGQAVPKPKVVRILGQHIPQGLGNKATIELLETMATQVGGMMRRIRNKRHGIKEKEAVQLVQAFIVSRLTYGTLYLKLNKTEMNKLNAILRKAYKNALGLPEWTATDKLLRLGVHNSMEELHEAQIISQLKRLDATTNGKWLLDRLGMAVPGGTQVPEGEEEIDHDTRQKFKISKLPKNMHPERDEGRRRARTAALAHSWDNREGTLYVDAAGPSLGVAAIAVASAQGKILRVASIRADSAEQAEEAAIALAVSCNPRATVITDSQKACRNYARGVLGRPASRILKKVQVQAMGVHLIWAPGHMGHTGNEAANAAARAALYRDSSLCPVEPAPDMPYNKYLATLRQVRKEFPAPHKSLSKKEEFIWRRLQTDTVTTPTKLHTWYPERFHSASCPFCGAPWADVHHLAWVCKKIPGLTPLEEPKKEEWEAGLRSEEADKQKLLVGRAGVVIDAIGALD
ncbi:hypothetical protein HPB47_007024 [Ixodes persulcatus]|uniref:Uncharacterized protein n=1 Tax=Ixodes persulcatus TaxID=34615 RepID=A0AC60P980_IXOPE|nr:hypothetical protein HPB47_007024 [Ixodes persulcatus]